MLHFEYAIKTVHVTVTRLCHNQNLQTLPAAIEANILVPIVQ